MDEQIISEIDGLLILWKPNFRSAVVQFMKWWEIRSFLNRSRCFINLNFGFVLLLKLCKNKSHRWLTTADAGLVLSRADFCTLYLVVHNFSVKLSAFSFVHDFVFIGSLWFVLSRQQIIIDKLIWDYLAKKKEPVSQYPSASACWILSFGHFCGVNSIPFEFINNHSILWKLNRSYGLYTLC